MPPDKNLPTDSNTNNLNNNNNSNNNKKPNRLSCTVVPIIKDRKKVDMRLEA